MLEGITESALKTLLAQGTGWVVAVLCIVAIIVLVRKVESCQKLVDDCRKLNGSEVQELYEKRLTEWKTLLDALNRSSEALGTMRVSVDARTEAINQLTAGFANLVRDLDNNRTMWRDKGEQINSSLTDLARRIEDLQRRTP